MSPLSFGKFCIVGVKVAPELRELPISLFQVGRKRDAGPFFSASVIDTRSACNLLATSPSIAWRAFARAF
jgi:hypothetical protein